MTTTEPYPVLFCMGNPLLDMQVTNGEALLAKYKLKANDAILAAPEQMELYQDIVDSKDVTYIAGGAAQNTARGAAVRDADLHL
jgi:adenosine kinase